MNITVTRGPSLRVPFAAVIGEFDVPAAPFASGAGIATQIAEWLPANLAKRLSAHDHIETLPQWVMQLSQVVTEAHGRMKLPAEHGVNGPRGWTALGYHEATATTHAMRFALVATLHANLPSAGAAIMKPRAAATINTQLTCQPRFQTRALMRAARQRGIPVYAVADGSSIWQFGQGGKGWHSYSSSTQFDSTTGIMLQQNKAQSNSLVRQLSFPGVEHGIADRLQRAHALAEKLGYPLVIKPLDSGMGLGVTVNVNNSDDVAAAFRNALKYSRRRQVIVERFVAGNDYRIMVTGGKFQWAIQRMPPEVIGDGTSSIAALIQQKNARVANADVDKGFAKHIVMDEETRRVIALQHMNPEDHPPAGTVVRLRGNANVSTGGSFVDVTGNIHPDNCAMAETIARAFRLDSMGIDFLTGDIRRSWREGRCAVIEVNATPMQFSDAHATQLLGSKFAEGDNGRIPSVLLLCDTPTVRNRLFSELAGYGRGIGAAVNREARLNGLARSFGKNPDAGAAVQALLLDPDCKALTAICTLRELHRRGLPLDRFDACLWAEGAEPDPALLALLNASCNTVAAASTASVTDTLRTLLT